MTLTLTSDRVILHVHRISVCLSRFPVINVVRLRGPQMHIIPAAVRYVFLCIGSHTADHLAENYTAMIDDWNLRPKTHVVLRDNAKNMERCMTVANLPSLGCFVHTMHPA